MIKTLRNHLLRNQCADINETWIVDRGLNRIIICSNDNPGLTLTYFVARSNLASLAFVWGNVTIKDSLEIFAACDMEFV